MFCGYFLQYKCSYDCSFLVKWDFISIYCASVKKHFLQSRLPLRDPIKIQSCFPCGKWLFSMVSSIFTFWPKLYFWFSFFFSFSTENAPVFGQKLYFRGDQVWLLRFEVTSAPLSLSLWKLFLSYVFWQQQLMYLLCQRMRCICGPRVLNRQTLTVYWSQFKRKSVLCCHSC